MSEPWTDERIREAFIYDGGESEYHDPEHGAQVQRKVAGDIFDRWLAERDRRVAERAWDEGFDAYEADWQHHNGAGWGDEECIPATYNPYREQNSEGNET